MPNNRDRKLDAFTLFEVAVSLVVMALGVLAVAALLPRSLEQLNLSRQKIYASAIAMDLSSHFSYGYVRNNKTRGDYYHLSKVANSPDIERCSNSYLSSPVDYRSMAPVPTEILLRLDSDNDAIRNLVRDGVPVFYPMPRQMDAASATTAATNLLQDGETITPSQQANSTFESQGAELGQIIFAVVGDPQLNADWAMMHYTLAREPGEIAGAGSARIGRGWPWFIGGGYSTRNGLLTIAHDNSNVGTASVRFPVGLTRGVNPRKGYFWDYPVRILDSYQTWPAWSASPLGGDALNLTYSAAPSAYNHREDRAQPVVNSLFPATADVPKPINETDSLFQPFEPEQRCRQIIFWSVNWKAYEDSEEAMPADCDISAFNVGTNLWNEKHSSAGYNDGVGHPEIGVFDASAAAKRLNILWRRVAGADKQPTSSKTDPVFTAPPAVTWTTGDFNYGDIFLSVRGETLASGLPGRPHVPLVITTNPDGNWWFDRNINGRRDVGSIPRGTRLRARTISRFNVYDPRLYLVMR